MKIFYTADDMYPIYYSEDSDTPWAKSAEVPEKVWNEYREALGNFQEALDKLGVELNSYYKGNK